MMRAAVFALLATFLLVAGSVPITASSAEPAVRITEVHPRPAADGREFIELWNPGDADVDLAGWNLTDGINTFTFESWNLGPGERVVVWGGGNDSALGPTWKPNVWNNGGDTVALHDADGTIVDAMEYGTAEVPAPGEGISLHWDGAWVEGDPTPGQDMQGSDGSATATVDDLPPQVTLIDPPAIARPGETVTLRFEIDEPNGDEVQWTVQAEEVEVANGTHTGTFQANASAPDGGDTWTWTVTATSTNHQTVVHWGVEISHGPFRIVLPDDGIRFPGIVPGATDVNASGPFRIIHQGTDPAVPHIDLSPFKGDATEIPVDGNVGLHLVHDDNTTSTIQYDGPLQALPSLSPGESLDVTLVIQTVPSPLAAGDYRSSFTVVG